MIKINIHSSLARFTNNQTKLELMIDNTANILPILCQNFDKLRDNIFDQQGQLSPYVNIYVNGKNLNQLEPTLMSEKDTIDVVTALVGG